MSNADYILISLQELLDSLNKAEPVKLYEITDFPSENSIDGIKRVRVLVINYYKIHHCYNVLEEVLGYQFYMDPCRKCAFKGKLCRNLGSSVCRGRLVMEGNEEFLESVYLEILSDYEDHMNSESVTKLEVVKKLCNPDFCIYYNECEGIDNMESCIVKILFN